MRTLGKIVIGFAVVVLLASFFCIGYLAFAVIAPDRVQLTSQGSADLSGIAAATAAAALATLTIAVVVANSRLATSSEALATLTAKQLRDQWEPDTITTRLNQVSGRWPLSVTITNLSTGPAIDCVYVGVFKDSREREMCHVTGPIDLLAGNYRELALNLAHGYDHIRYEASDTTSVDPQTTKPIRRVFQKIAIAFSSDSSLDQSNPATHSVSHVGLPVPAKELFYHPDRREQGFTDRRDAVICRCANGHVHRTLPYLGTASERFSPDDPKVSWVNWYMQEARYGIAVPEEASLLKQPDAVLVRTEPL